ncbi:MAG: ferredoxin [Dehalococcoidia bacterium]|nr:ferredoxin [Dehalococcoidia bacterium]
MRVVVKAELCEGNGKCEAAAPEVFRLGEDDLSRVLVDEVPEALLPRVEQAIRLCPRQALAWVGNEPPARE